MAMLERGPVSQPKAGKISIHRSPGKRCTTEKSLHGTSGEAMERSASIEARSASLPYLTGDQRQHRSVRGDIKRCRTSTETMVIC